MTKINFHTRRTETATALRSMGTLLSKKGVCIDVSPLDSAAAQVSQGGRRDANWSYEIHDLTFKVSSPKNIYPSSACDFRVSLSLRLAGQFTLDSADQFETMEINVEKYALGRNGVKLKSAWHFDRHIIDTTKDDPHITDDIHPLYHFQFGGAKMASISDDLGSTFLVDPPRIMHPPLDGILAIDFVLSNYEGVSWKQLREEGQYVNLVDAKLEELWKPYFTSVSNSWQNPREHLSRFLCPSVKQRNH
jgi:hypothetical protein